MTLQKFSQMEKVKNKPQVSKSFEAGFLSRALCEQIAHCDNYELATLFLELFRSKQPVLEAGCGSGRWCGWLQKHSIHCDGIDWSEELCRRASSEIPQSQFIPCDMKETPFPDCTYAGIVALGSIEHSKEGPHLILKEFHRILKPEGVAVITVPYGGPLRTLLRYLNKPVFLFKSSTFVRRLFGKPVGRRTLRLSRKDTIKRWHPRFLHGPDGWFFYEYEFNKSQMRTFLTRAGFEIQDEFVGFGNEGVLHNFGKISGNWNHVRGDVDFSLLGRFLRKVVPVSVMGHMLCYVVVKRELSQEK